MSTYASYKPGTFTLDVSNFEIGPRLFHPKDMPAFLHEYCHYIQDITTISGIFGFSLWLYDVVNLTRIFSDGQGKTILLPLGKDEQGHPINQYRKFYNLFCGNADDVFDIDYKISGYKSTEYEITEIPLTKWNIQLRLNRVLLEGRHYPIQFRLIALQEIQAFYAQQLAERYFPDVQFSYPSSAMKSYPYKFGDHLFEAFAITLPLEAKFILVGLCLDTIQAPTVFLSVLEILSGQVFEYTKESLDRVAVVVEQARKRSSYSTADALQNIMPDLKKWADDPGRLDFCLALNWYIIQVETAYKFKEENPYSFDNLFCQGINGLVALFKVYPAPAYWNKGALDGNTVANADQTQQEIYRFNYDSASTFYMLRVLYDFLCSKDLAELNAKSSCPLFEKCSYREALNDDYTCLRSPWEIVKGKTKIPCPYGVAAASLGLWQNSIDFKI